MGCFGLLILGFVIFCIIRAGNKKGNQTVKQNQPMTNQSVKQNQPTPNQSAGQKRTTGRTGGYGQGNRAGAAYTKPTEAAKQQELKSRLQSKYGDVSHKQQETKNVEKRKEENVSQLPEPPAEDLIQEINDLMVKGYDGELTFSRDFVAEGIEMLNRIQM